MSQFAVLPPPRGEDTFIPNKKNQEEAHLENLLKN
jgi:hypothetical protein